MTARLRVYAFGPDAEFGGLLVGALERIDGTDLLDALFVLRDAESGELQAIDRATGLGDGSIAEMLDFRLDPARRPAATKKAMAAGAEAIETIAAALAEGGAVLAVVVAGDSPPELEEAVARSGGTLIGEEPAGDVRLVNLTAQLREVFA
jgi:hypothetical protein